MNVYVAENLCRLREKRDVCYSKFLINLWYRVSRIRISCSVLFVDVDGVDVHVQSEVGAWRG